MIYSFKIGGPAGYGIKSAGKIFAQALINQGFNAFYYSEYPSLIRGGHNTVQVDFSDHKVYSTSSQVDLLVSLEGLALKMDLSSLSSSGFVLYDKSIQDVKIRLPKDRCFALPFSEIAQKLGNELMRNSVALGASFAFLKMDIAALEKAFKESFKDKTSIKLNLQAAEAGYHYAHDNFSQVSRDFLRGLKMPKRDLKSKKFLTGNEAVAIGAVVGGCKFYCAYPMTPSTSILHYLEAHQRETDMIVHQGEDEIGVINTALGASFAGARSMIATSGGGFALMNEGLSLAGITETPLVIVEVMRPAPATGLPTWTEQGDLSFILGAGHGDFPKVVLAPGDPEEAYELTQKALNLSEKYQLPVILVSDKFLGESIYSVFNDDLLKRTLKIERGRILKSVLADYHRYENAPDGVSPRVLPGTEDGEFIANSDEHNSAGFSVEGYNKDRKIQMDKRQRKLEFVKREMEMPVIYGPKKAEITIISWGSNKGPILDALELIDYQLPKGKINYLHFSYLYPLDWQKLQKVFQRLGKLILIENNYSGQLGRYLREGLDVHFQKKILKYDGRPFWRDEIIETLKAIQVDGDRISVGLRKIFHS